MAPQPKEAFSIPEIPSILPKTPVTLSGDAIPSVAPAPRKPPTPDPPVAAAPVVPKTPVPAAQEHADGSVDLGAAIFEHDEYEAPRPQQAAPAADVDPAEIEKARRFARIIVSDIALYNQEAVIEGIRNGQFFELLREDITEGRALYDGRVPEAIRATKDYLQEAFDEFIASKKKLR
jgi:hypothetical protein